MSSRGPQFVAGKAGGLGGADHSLAGRRAGRLELLAERQDGAEDMKRREETDQIETVNSPTDLVESFGGLSLDRLRNEWATGDGRRRRKQAVAEGGRWRGGLLMTETAGYASTWRQKGIGILQYG